MSYRAANCNAHAPSSAAKNRATINAAAAKCDVLLVQEADSQVVAAIRDLDGWSHYTPAGLGGRNPVAWRTGMFELVTSGWSRIMANKAKVKDGPDRSMVWVVLREKATGRTVVHVNAHMIHQAFTSHKERRPQWFASLAVLGAKVAILYARHRCPVVINGDWNNPGEFNIPGIDEREVPSPATFGKRRYDRFFIVGKATATNRYALATPSDHDTLVATITLLGASPAPKPKPAPAKETPVARSQNGYPANDRNYITTWTIPGTTRKVALAEGAPGHLLTHFAAWFDKEIESVDGGILDDWGYAERPIRGSSTTLSNHASGTALDINAPRHPLGARNTFTNAQERKIREQLKVYDGCIRWGGDYQNRADEMHFEINKPRAEVRKVSDRLKRKTVVRKVKEYAKATVVLANVRKQFLIAAGVEKGRVSHRGGVEVIQRQLNRQYGAGLKVDGYVGKATLDAWGKHEQRVGISGRPRVPDHRTLIALSGLIFYVK